MVATVDSSSPLAVLTGGTGFLGSHIADALLAAGWRVRALTRPTSDRRWLAGKPVETVDAPLVPPSGREGDDTRLDELTAAVAGATAVVHCAGVVRARDEAGYRLGNVETTRRLLRAAAADGSVGRFVLISSLAAAGPTTPDRPLREDAPCRPVTAYGRSKLAAEALLRDGWPFATTALRPPALYGPRDTAFLPLFRLARRGWCVRLGRIAALSLVDGRDVATAVAALLRAERTADVYFIDDGRRYGYADLAASLAVAWNRRVRLLALSSGLLDALARFLPPPWRRSPLLGADRRLDLRAEAWLCSGERLRRDLGLSPARPLGDGFRETLAFYREAGWLDAP